MPFLTGYESTGINLDIQNYLSGIQENQQIISGKYLTNSHNPNFIEMVKHLYPGEEERFKILNPGSYIGGLIFDKLSSYIGKARIEQLKDNKINRNLVYETLLTTGYVMLKKSSTKIEGWKASAVEGHKYYDDGVTELFIEQYKVEEKNPHDNSIMDSKYYVYVQSFSNHVLSNKLFEIQKGILTFGKPVSLDIIPELKGRPDEQVLMEIDKLVEKEKIEDSLIEKIKTIIYSIERKYAEADKQFQNYMEQFTVFKNIEIPQNCRKTVVYNGISYEVTDFDKLGKVVEIDADNGTGSIEIIKNGNELITEALDFADRQLKMISAITDVPTIFLGLDSAQGNDSGTFVVKSSGSFYKRIEKYREGFESVLINLFESVKGNKKLVFVWPSIITSDPAEVIKNEKDKVDAGFSTKIMAIMKVHGINEIEAQKIYDAIQLEKQSELASNESETDPNIIITNDKKDG